MNKEAARRELQDVFMRLLRTSFTESGEKDLLAAVALLEQFPALASETFPIISLDSPWGAHPKAPLFLLAAYGAGLDQIKKVYNLHPNALLITKCPELVTLVKRSQRLNLNVLAFLAEKYPTLMARPNKVGRLAIQELLLSTKQPLRDEEGEAISRRDFQGMKRQIDVMIQCSPLHWCTAELLQRTLHASSISEEIVDIIVQHLPEDVEHLELGQAFYGNMLTMRNVRLIAKVLPSFSSFALRFVLPPAGLTISTPYESQDVFDFLLGELAVASCQKTSGRSKFLKRIRLDIPSLDDFPQVCQMFLPDSIHNISTLSHIELRALKRVTSKDISNIKADGDANSFQSILIKRLENNNTTLTHFKLEMSLLVPNFFSPIIWSKVQFFTSLNGYGRGRIRGMEASKAILVNILDGVTRDCHEDPTRTSEHSVPFLYALLQENPTLWVPVRKRELSDGQENKALPAKRRRLQSATRTKESRRHGRHG